MYGPLRAYQLAFGIRELVNLVEKMPPKVVVKTGLAEQVLAKAVWKVGSDSIPEQHMTGLYEAPPTVRKYCAMNAKNFKSQTASAIRQIRKQDWPKAAAALDRAMNQASHCAATVLEFCGGAKNPARLRQLRKNAPIKIG